MAVSARSYAPGRPGAACRYVLSPRRRPTTPELSRWILNGRKPVTAHVAAVLDDALDAAGEIVAAAEAEMASRLPRDMELTRRHLEETISAGAMSAAELDDWQRAMMRYGYRTRDVPSPALLDDLTGDLADLEAAITRHRSASALPRLAGVAAGMSGMMVLTLIKTGDRRAWRGWSRTAQHAALEAGDAKVLAWTRAQESYGWFYAGEMTTAIDTARAAQTGPCVGAALAAALEMRAHAARGDGGNARAVLPEAERFLDALPEADRTASAFGYGESQLRFHAGSAFTLLRDLPARSKRRPARWNCARPATIRTGRLAGWTALSASPGPTRTRGSATRRKRSRR